MKFAKRFKRQVRVTQDVINDYAGGKTAKVEVKDNALVLSKGYDVTLTKEHRGGAHFGVGYLLHEVEIPEGRLRTVSNKDNIIIYLD